MSSTEEQQPHVVPTEQQQQQSEQQQQEQQQTTDPNEEVLKLSEFTQTVPAHHHPNDGKPEIEVEDEWLLAEPSGFVSKLPTNDQWPVHDRLIFNTVEKEDAVAIKAAAAAAADLKDASYTALVTGASGIVGRRLVSMLIQRGATKVIAVDVLTPTDDIKAEHVAILGEELAASAIDYQTATIENKEVMKTLLDGVEVVYNTAALVDPVRHPTIAYERINHHAVKDLVSLAKEVGVKKFIQLSTPETRLDYNLGVDFVNKKESELSAPLSFEYRVEYARTKALGDKAVLEANEEDFLTAVIAPATVYSEYDDKFILPLLQAAKDNDLRIVGDGKNKMNITYADNACHAMIIAAAKLTAFDAAPAGQFYIVQDAQEHFFWGLVDDIIVRGGLNSMKHRFKAPTVLAKAVGFFAKLIDDKSKLNPYTITLLEKTRTFDISKAQEELGYTPIVPWEEAWLKTCERLLTQKDLPFYKNVTFYYQGVEIDMEAELQKVREAEYQEKLALLAAEKAAKEAEEAAAKEEEEKKKAQEEEEKQQQEQQQDAVVAQEEEAVVTQKQPEVVVEAPVVAAVVVPEVVASQPEPVVVEPEPVVVEEPQPEPVVVEEPQPVVEEVQQPEPVEEVPVVAQVEEQEEQQVDEVAKAEEEAAKAEEEAKQAEEEVAKAEEEAKQAEEEVAAPAETPAQKKKGKKGKK